MDIFKIEDPNRALNAVYDIASLGYWPFWLYAGSACYFVNITGETVGTSISSNGISYTEIRDPSDYIINIQAVKDGGESGTQVRIKISTSLALNFIAIQPLRIGQGTLQRYYQSEY